MKNETLFWWFFLFLAFHAFSAYCTFTSTVDWVNVDCGSDDETLDDFLLLWDIDDFYTNVGINKKIRINQTQPLAILNTLRSFPSSTTQQSCYKFHTYKPNLRYLVRSGFLYGNYDGLNRPPAFDLVLDGMKMLAIEPTSATEIVMEELVYTSEKSGLMNLCLAERKDGGVPFISSIQAIPTGDDLYSKMESNETFWLVARINYGKDDEFDVFSIDDYERMWTSGTTPPNCQNVSAIPDSKSPENDPPLFVLQEAIESVNASSPIILTVDFSKSSSSPSQLAYFVLYFTEVLNFTSEDNRTMNIFIDSVLMSTITTSIHKCTVVTLFPVHVKASTANVTLAAANSSVPFPPLITAMEVFTKVNATNVTGDNIDIVAGDSTPSMRFTFLSFVLILCVSVLANLT